MRKILGIIFTSLFVINLFASQQDSISILAQFDTMSLDSRADLFRYGRNINKYQKELSIEETVKLCQNLLEATEVPKHQNNAYKDTLGYKISVISGQLYLNELDYKQSKLYFLKALDYAKNLNSNQFIIEIYTAFGIIARENNNLVSALDTFLLAVEMYDSTKTPNRFLVNLYGNISGCFFDMGEVQQAINYEKKTLEFYLNLPPSGRRSYSLLLNYIHLSKGYRTLEKVDSADYYNLLVKGPLNHLHEMVQKGEHYLPYEFFQAYNAGLISITKYYLSHEKQDSARIYYQKLDNTKFLNSQKKYLVDIAYKLASEEELKALDTLINQKKINLEREYLFEFQGLAEKYYNKIGDAEKSLAYQLAQKDYLLEKSRKQRVRFVTFTNNKIKLINQKKQIADYNAKQQVQQKLFMLYACLTLLLLVLLIVLYYLNYQKGEKNKYLTKTLADKKIITEQAEKLQLAEKQKNKLITNITHEYQTPLSIINGLSKQMLSNSQLQPDFRESLELINRNSENLSNHTQQVLMFNAPDTNFTYSKFEKFSIQALINHLLFEYQAFAKQKNIILVEQKLPTLPVIVYTDLYKLETILHNLLSNAIKYSSQNEKIVICFKDLKNGYHQISITDNGIGISNEEIPHIFNRYFQSKEANHASGIGLGLAICKEYAISLKGNIKVTSELGKGSTFTLTFPISKKENIPQDAPLYMFANTIKLDKPVSLNQQTATIPSQKILIVEDNLDYCKYLEKILSNNYLLDFVHNGVQAIEYLKSQNPNIIITDWMMPDMDGLTFIQQLKKTNCVKKYPILMLTARSLETDKFKALKLGIDGYLTKSVDSEKLIGHINDLLKDGKHKSNLIIPTKDQKWLLTFEEKVVPNLSDFNLNLREVAESMSVSTLKLNQKLKETTGLTPKRYIQELRFWEARRLLETKECESVKAACYSVGFKDIKNFSKRFKEKFGFYPSDFLN